MFPTSGGCVPELLVLLGEIRLGGPLLTRFAQRRFFW